MNGRFNVVVVVAALPAYHQSRGVVVDRMRAVLALDEDRV
jgi:hypothetical protein